MHNGLLPDFLPVEISPAEVKRRLGAGEHLRLIDVREPGEYGLARLPDAELIPMRTVPSRLRDLDDESETPLIIFCHHGVRSLNVVSWLRQQGVGNAQSMAGGLDLWSLMIDPTVPRY